jgi:ParB family chromosome partitioning protein
MSAAEEPRRRGLGRGLSALLGDPVVDVAKLPGTPGRAADPSGVRGVRNLPVDVLRPGKFQPRRNFDPTAISNLVESVRDKGILQPLLVRRHPLDAGAYEIVAGERRWRAAQEAKLHQVPAIVLELSDREALEVALIENLQRQDLSPLEEAEGYRRLMEDFAHTQDELAKTVGKSRSHVANTLRLLALPDSVKLLLDEGQLTAGHARALLTSADPAGLAKEVVNKGLNVRQTEKLAQRVPGRGKAKPAADGKDADVLALERDLSACLGLKVTIGHQAKGGEVVIHYQTLEQLDHILHRLSDGQHGQAVRSEVDGMPA